MRFVILIAGQQEVEPPVGVLPIEEWVRETDAKGIRLTGDRLRPVADATTVRVRDGEVLVTDGPFAEGTEQIGGFDLLECTDLDEALEVAARHPWASMGGIEVRPVWPFTEQGERA